MIVLTNEGEVGTLSHTDRFDVHEKRPFIYNGNTYINRLVPNGDPTNPEHYKPVRVLTNGTLLRDEWIAIDRTLVGLKEKRFGGVQHLKDMGLTKSIDGMSMTMYEWRDYSDALTAHTAMRPVVRHEADRQKYTSHYVPLPIDFVDFELDKRELAVSRRSGTPFDTGLIERAGRRLMEKSEQRLFGSGAYKAGDGSKDGTVYGYLSQPNRNTLTIKKWGDDATPAEMKDDVIKMINAMNADNFYGPFVIYVSTVIAAALQNDYVVGTSSAGYTTVSGTIKQRLMEIDQVADIRTIDYMPAKTVIAVSMEQDVVQLLQGLDQTVVQWAVEGEFITHYKVLQIEVPMIRHTQDGKSGVLHCSWS